MLSRLSKVRLREHAANWAIRSDGGDCSAADLKQRDAWLAADPAHREAFDKARALWLELDVAAVTAARRAQSSSAQSSSLRVSSRSRLGLSVAAMLLITVAAGLLLREQLWLQVRTDERSAVGESRWVTLDDGSRVQLNTDSAIAVDYSRARRDVALLSGEAAFEVAHDAERPFRVTAANGTVTAIGTVFQVRLHEQEGQVSLTQVIVTAGRVRVQDERASTEVSAGEQVGYSAGQLGEVGAADLATASAWRRGQLSFVDQPLGIVLAELDRYYPGRIVLADASLANYSVSGVFQTAKPLAAIDAIERNLGLTSQRSAGRVVLKNLRR